MTDELIKGPRGGKTGKKPFGKPFRAFGKPGKPFKGRGGRILREAKDPAQEGAVLYGWHSVTEALKNPRRKFRKLLVTDNALRRLEEEGIPLPIAPQSVQAKEIDVKLSSDAVHQGFYAETDHLEAPAIDELAPEGMVLVLDQITDPHNVGAIVRSACAFGVKAIITTSRHSPEMTGVLAKSASGGLEHVPFVLVQNLSRALAELKDQGFYCVGLDSDGGESLTGLKLQAPVAIVLGAEGKGLRQLTRETCDVVAQIDLPGEIKSLNVSNAAALAMHIVGLKTGLFK